MNYVEVHDFRRLREVMRDPATWPGSGMKGPEDFPFDVDPPAGTRVFVFDKSQGVAVFLPTSGGYDVHLALTTEARGPEAVEVCKRLLKTEFRNTLIFSKPPAGRRDVIAFAIAVGFSRISKDTLCLSL